MSFKKLRIELIKKLIDQSERLFFERKLLKFYRQAFKPETISVIDVGANKGQSIDFFLKLNRECKIYAFEPNPVLFRLLQKKYSHLSNISLFNMGISDKPGEKMFFENVFDYTSTFEILNPQSKSLKRKSRILGVKPQEIVANKYPVQIETLADFIKANISGPVDILKIDTEGHEYYCLLGLFSDSGNINLRFIQIENHIDDMYANPVSLEKINELLNAHSYRLNRKISHAIGTYDELIYERSGG